MPGIKKILYATDLSPNASFAMRFALSTANHYHADIVILHVLDDMLIGHAYTLFKEHADAIKQKIKKRLESTYASALDKHLAYGKLKCSIEICSGFPPETILNAADDFECDMIVMGTHGKGVLGHTFLGSTTKRVLGRTRKPIFVIPLPKE